MERRNTIQKNLVLKAVQDMKSHVTADDVHNHIIKDYPNVGKGTVYRNLNILAEEGLIKKIEIPNGSDRFDFTLEEHYHIRCVKCGNVSDVDMDVISGLIEHIHDTHGIKIIDYDIMFRGVCAECQ